jgi:uncharacterized membrane protein YdjX (TVP38/TMEM64 family)
VAKGTAVVSVASTLGASASFLISRYLARPLVAARLAGSPRFSAIDRGVAARGGSLVFLLRLSPLLPFGLLNYTLGLTDVRFGSYVAASWAGMLPGTLAYVYLGSVGKAAADAAASGGGAADYGRTALFVVGGLATLVATQQISKIAARAIEETEAGAEADSPPPAGRER